MYFIEIMNILFLMGIYPSYGGVEKVSTILANEFVNRGYEVTIVSFDQPHPELVEKELNPTVKLYKLDFPVSKKSNINALREIVKIRSIDIIINQWAVPFYVASLCRKALKGTDGKLVTVHHNLPDTNAKIKDLEIRLESGLGNRIFNRIKLRAVRLISRINLRMVYNVSDLYIVLSESFIPIVQRFIRLKKLDHIISLPNPITIPVPSGFDENSKENEIICVGRIEYNQKRTFRLLEVWEKLQDKFPDWKLTFVGDGPDKSDLVNRIISKGLKRVNITGFTDPIKYYSRAKILVMTSEYEGMPLVLAEGMCHGVIPVVLNSFPSCSDLIPNRGIGRIVTMPFSAESFSQYLKELMDSQMLQKKLSRNAYEHSLEYSLPSIVDKWEQIFSKLINRNNGFDALPRG